MNIEVLQVVLSFFQPQHQVLLQAINRVFYYKVTPNLSDQCTLFKIGNVTKGYCLLSHQDHLNILEPETLTWKSMQIREKHDQRDESEKERYWK